MNDATKHSGPVDVRAVIRAVIEELRADGNTGHVQSLLDADAAVAYLVEALRLSDEWIREAVNFGGCKLKVGQTLYRNHRALSNIRSAL